MTCRVNFLNHSSSRLNDAEDKYNKTKQMASEQNEKVDEVKLCHLILILG